MEDTAAIAAHGVMRRVVFGVGASTVERVDVDYTGNTSGRVAARKSHCMSDAVSGCCRQCAGTGVRREWVHDVRGAARAVAADATRTACYSYADGVAHILGWERTSAAAAALRDGEEPWKWQEIVHPSDARLRMQSYRYRTKQIVSILDYFGDGIRGRGVRAGVVG
ncbi:hypothetical protein B0H19DRAFT_1063229 [Mycena capillaripes]|nr:hypothetical protein B0H19DRAFT_1063229 [Mycena capillaripes]